MSSTPSTEPPLEAGTPATNPSDSQPAEQDQNDVRPIIVYTRAQLLHLSKSPLVAPPPGMPDLKDWFGTESDQSHKRDPEPTTPNRERRFRRDHDDGETPSRPSFRSALSQPSQMGNFKHHSLRSTDREDKDSNERLRNLSDKYDRDRLTLPLAGLRNKDRDTAPHLPSSSGRTGSQPQLSTIASRRAESKKKAGETSEDWRSKGREDKSDNGRSERARSRARDSSRTRRDASTSRRDRDRDERERRRAERDNDEDDRRWRDDGKRDERMAARRDRQRDKDKDTNIDRWNVVEDSKEGRNKRNGRDRRGHDESEDRRDRDKDQKQPAWMETYVPSSDAPGILGGQSADGQLDGIQAWKKGVQEKEQKDKAQGATPASHAPPESKLDEIQMFRLLMEKEQRKPDNPSSDVHPTARPDPGSSVVADPAISGISSAGHHVELNGDSSNIKSPESTTQPSASDQRYLLSLLTNDKAPSSSANGAPVEQGSVASTSRFFPKPLTNAKLPDPQVDPAVFQAASPSPSSRSSGSRLLALARPPSASSNPLDSATALQHPALHGLTPNSDVQASFSPFEEAHFAPIQRPQPGHDDFTAIPDPHRLPERGPFPAHEVGLPSNEAKGSRFAKYFDDKAKDHAARTNMPGSLGPLPGRSNGPGGRPLHSQNETHTMDELFTMLNNSSSPHARLGHPNGPSGLGSNHVNHLPSNIPPFPPSQPSQPPPLLPHHSQQLLNDARLESFYDSRAEDRSFVPDGMVPGLRTAPPPRDRLYQEAMEDMRYSGNRLPLHLRQGDPIYNGPGGYGPPSGRNMNLPINQGQFRGGPSPLLHNQGQRIPPGLANLGARPPQDHSQLLGLQSLQGGNSHLGGPAGQIHAQFNAHNYTNGARGPGAQQVLGGPPQSTMLNNPNHIDLRQQQQLLSMAGPNVTGGRGLGPGYGPQHSGMAQQPLGLRHGQQSQLHPNLVSQQNPSVGGPHHGAGMNNQPAQELMALLMGGPRD